MGDTFNIIIGTEIRRRAFDHHQTSPFGFSDEQKTDDFVGWLTMDSVKPGEIAHHGSEDLFIAVTTFLNAFARMLIAHIDVAPFTAAVVPTDTWLTVRYGNRMTRNRRAISAPIGDINAGI